MDDCYTGHSLASEFHPWMDFSALMSIDNSHLLIRGLALAEEPVVNGHNSSSCIHDRNGDSR
jgi:hypothetical protein